jgi:tetratricopeptide (TPR) repeat protein
MNLEALLKGGISPEFDFDLVSVPANGDKMVRLRTLEEALDEFEGEFGGSADAEDLQRYLIQIKPRKERPPVTEISKPGAAGGEKRSPSSINESVYLHDGTLNIEFLMQNADLLFASGEYALARNIYAKVIQEGHSSLHTSQALLATAKCFEQDDCFDGARKSYEESIAYRPCFETYQRLASLKFLNER